MSNTTFKNFINDILEALTPQQRIQRGRMMKKIQAKIKMGRAKAEKRVASKDTLEKRALRQARLKIFQKMTQGASPAETSFSRKAEIEKRLGSPAMKRKIAGMAKKAFKDVRKAEMEKKRGPK
jgi:hypothetical protein